MAYKLRAQLVNRLGRDDRLARLLVWSADRLACICFMQWQLGPALCCAQINYSDYSSKRTILRINFVLSVGQRNQRVWCRCALCRRDCALCKSKICCFLCSSGGRKEKWQRELLNIIRRNVGPFINGDWCNAIVGGFTGWDNGYVVSSMHSHSGVWFGNGILFWFLTKPAVRGWSMQRAQF